MWILPLLLLLLSSFLSLLLLLLAIVLAAEFLAPALTLLAANLFTVTQSAPFSGRFGGNSVVVVAGDVDDTGGEIR